MTPEDDEARLRAALAEAHRRDGARTPSFERRPVGRSPDAARLWRSTAWRLPAALAAAAVALWTCGSSPEPQPPPTWQPSGTRWIAPTDFLLETPDLITLRTLPGLDPSTDSLLRCTARTPTRRPMNRRALWILLAFLLLAPPGRAAESPGAPGADPIGSKLFPPELIMEHQAEIGLDDRQREAILKEIERGQQQFPRLQWQLQAASQQLVKLLDGPQVDEAKALAQASEVMKLETEIKKAHLTLLIRIRNVLTEAQRAKLQALRR